MADFCHFVLLTGGGGSGVDAEGEGTILRRGGGGSSPHSPSLVPPLSVPTI